MRKLVCELFAGVGGFRLGLERANPDWETVWFSQWEPSRKTQWAHHCYTIHWQDNFENTNKDISLVDKNTIPQHNLLVGGFPCQDYSVARSLSGNLGLEGKKGVLWWQIREILEIKRPSFVLLENVDRLLKSPASQRGRDFGVMLACFADLNYSVEWRVINAAEYGNVQKRKRIFIFAYLNTTLYSSEIGDNSLEIINNTGLFANTFPISDTTSHSSTSIDYKDIASVSENFSFNFQNSGFMNNGNVFSVKSTPILEDFIPLANILEANVAEKYFITDNLDKWEYLKSYKKVDRVSKSGHKYIFSEGSMAFPDSLDKPARTILTAESSLNRSSHIIKDPENDRYRVLTPIETERIQGFDDNWTNTGMPERTRYFTMGNALVVPIVTRIASRLDEIFENEPDV